MNTLHPRVIVIGSADVIKLCVIRAVGELGCHVDVLQLTEGKYNKHKPIDCYSKYVNNYYFVDKTNDRTIVRFLLDNCAAPNQKPIIITLDDYSTFIIDKFKEELESCFLFAHSSNNGGLAELMNKHLMKSLAKEAGLNVVMGWPIVFEKEEYRIPEDIKYPCFIKGLYSYNNSKAIQKKCNSKEELVSFLKTCIKQFPYSVYAEEYIQIDKEFGVIGVCDREKCTIPAKAELLVFGQGSNHGVSMLGQVKPLNSDSVLCQSIRSLLSKLHYVGIFNVDFVESQGKFFFVELNFRFAAYGYGVLRAGVNLPALFINNLSNSFHQELKTHFNGEFYYLNEKIAFTNIINGAIRMSEYKLMKQKADFLMVSDKNDPAPGRFFIYKYYAKYLLSRLKRIVNKTQK